LLFQSRQRPLQLQEFVIFIADRYFIGICRYAAARAPPSPALMQLSPPQSFRMAQRRSRLSLSRRFRFGCASNALYEFAPKLIFQFLPVFLRQPFPPSMIFSPSIE